MANHFRNCIKMATTAFASTKSSAPQIQRHAGGTVLHPLIPSLVDLASGSEMSSYGEPQWSFLLGGADIDAFVVPAENENSESYEKEEGSNVAPAHVLGNVLRVKLSDTVSGYGMVLVDPSQRGKGYARSLIDAAMQKSSCSGKDNVKKDVEDPGRSILAICTKLGVPVYRKMGFHEVGLVTGLSGPVSSFSNADLTKDETAVKVNICSSPPNENKRQMFTEMDTKATGYNRQNRISLLLSGTYSPESLSATAFATEWDDETKCDVAVGAAAIRQDCPGGPLVVGPVMGEERAAIPLVRALARSFPARDDGDDDDDAASVQQLSIMISDHIGLVDRFVGIDGVERGIEGPAMSLDARPVYEGGDGSYLALMHPTLG